MNIEPKSHGIVCDNPACDWEDATIQVADWPEWLNQPCPKCGQKVLTEEDLQNAQVVLAAIELFNRLPPELLEALKPQIEEAKNSAFWQNAMSAELLDGLGPDDKIKVAIGTHKEISVKSIERLPSTSSSA